MDPFLDNTEEDLARARRAERMAQMKREKQLQEERRRMIKRLLPVGACALAVLILLIAGVVALVRKPKENNEPQQVQVEENSGSESAGQAGADKTEAAGNSDSQDPAITAGNNTAQIPNEANTSDSASAQNSAIGQKAAAPLYNFESTSETSGIYSEEVISTHAILINESTDAIVASKNARERISPASMTKVLTVLVAAENITEDELDNTFTMTLDITDYAYVNDCSSVGFLENEQVTVRDLFYGTVLPSGGDAAVGLATYVAGSHEAFVDMMNDKLEELGLAESTHYTNCVGLYDENHYSTVYDMAVIMKAALQNEFCKEVLSEHTYTTAPTKEHPEGITISNWFLRRIEDKDTGGEVLCAKTGYVVESKNCAVSYQENTNGDAFICVTTGAHSSWRCIYDHVEIYNRYVSQ